MHKIILVTIALMLLSSVGYGADWKYYTNDADGSTYFYDTQSVSREQDTTKVWVKELLSDKAKARQIKNHPNAPEIEKISINQYRLEINCSKNMMRVLSSVGYSAEDTVISNSNFPDSQFQGIVPDSNSAKLVKSICK